MDYGISEISGYNWMHRLWFDHLKGRIETFADTP